MFTERGRFWLKVLILGMVATIGMGMPSQGMEGGRAEEAGTREEVARVVWGSSTGAGPLRYKLKGRQITDPDGARKTFGFISTRRCLPRQDTEVRTCIVSAALKKVKDHLDLNATLSEGRFMMHFARSHHKATWDGSSGTPDVRIDELQEGEAAVERGADAHGSVFGARLEEHGVEEASLQSGVHFGTGIPPAPGPRLPGFGSAPRLSSSTCWNIKDKERGFVRAMNRARRSREVGRLRFDPELSKAARVHTRKMIRQTLLHHTPSDTLRRRVTRWVLLGENVGVGGTVPSLHSAFMASPGHRANILLPRFDYVGVGTASDGGRLWVTVIFERRKNPGTRLRMPEC